MRSTKVTDRAKALTITLEWERLAKNADELVEAQALKDYKDKTARPIAGWQAAKPTCGKGIELGMIDNSVDVNHPALKGQKIEFRSFHKKGRRPGPAVAAIMVGKPEWGGLLPGTKLKAASMFEKNKVGRVVGSSVALLKSINWLAKKRSRL